jgi:hypothetical protein
MIPHAIFLITYAMQERFKGACMSRVEMLQIVEQFSRNAGVVEGQTKVTRVPDSVTMYVETVGESGRSIFFNEFKVDGKTFWAGYSSRSDTVFISLNSRG